MENTHEEDHETYTVTVEIRPENASEIIEIKMAYSDEHDIMIPVVSLEGTELPVREGSELDNIMTMQ